MLTAGTSTGARPFPLVVTLTWDTEADLDLHVVIPNVVDPTTPIEIWAKHPIGIPIPTLEMPIDPYAVATAPYLDFDSNANCVIDGRRQENVIFQAPPPPGSYAVLVDTPSLCGQPDAQWTASATLDGRHRARHRAVGVDRRRHARRRMAGSGRLAFTFAIPTQ